MKRTIVTAMLLFSGAAFSDHVDVIEFTLNEGCSKEQYLEIVNLSLIHISEPTRPSP